MDNPDKNEQEMDFDPSLLDKESLDEDTLRQEQIKSLNWAIQKLNNEAATVDSKLSMMKQIQKLEDSLGSIETSSDEANAIIDGAREKLQKLNNDSEHKEMTYEELIKSKIELSDKITKASERLNALQGPAETETNTAQAVAPEQPTTPQVQTQPENLAQQNPVQANNITPEQQAQVAYAQNLAAQPAVVPTGYPQQQLQQAAMQATQAAAAPGQIPVAIMQQPQMATVPPQHMPVQYAQPPIVQPQPYPQYQQQAPVQQALSPEEQAANLERENLFQNFLSDFQTQKEAEKIKEQTLSYQQKPSINTNISLKTEPSVLSKKPSKSWEQLKLQALQTKRNFNSLKNRTLKTQPIPNTMDHDTFVNVSNNLDIPQPQSHSATMSLRPETKKLVVEMADQLGISSSELLDRGISAVLRMILRNNGRITFPMEVQQIDIHE